MRHGFFSTLIVTSALSVLPLAGWAADNVFSASSAPADASDVLNLSLQQLSDVEVTSVSKKAEKESQAPAAIYVITQEDIRRSGLQNVPELLRMVPGLQVAQSGSQNWAVSSRGFDSQFANKLLVMIDGRTIYSPVFSGVQWDVQNVMLEDIDRIEVIRGPGATLWGANAVNGVINIITKSAKDTQGTLVTAAAGNQERIGTAARYGGTVGDLSYRTYAQYFNDNQEHTVANPALGVSGGASGEDQWHNGQGGFRMDWGNSGSSKDQITLQGDAYQGEENAMRFLPVTSTVNPSLINAVDDTDDVSGMNILGRWTHEINTGSNITLQAYYDDIIKEIEYVGIGQHTQTFDVDFQHNLSLDSRNDIAWGLGYRRINSEIGNGFYISFAPENYYENLYSGFLQDKITLVEDKLFFTLGSKLEHNDFSGLEYEPSARIAWTPTSNQTVWSAVSRAVHTPTQADQDISLMLAPVSHTPTVMVAEQGNLATVSEELTAYELGYRIQPKENLSFDLTGFINEYRDLASLTPGTPSLAYSPTMGYYIYDPEVRENANYGETQGFELASTWEAARWLKLSGGYSLFYETLHITGASLVTENGTAPHQQFNARSYVDLPYHMQWDTMVYYVDALPALAVPAYTRLDTRFGYTPLPGLDLSLIGQNLLQSEHQEFSPFLYETPEEIGRSFLAKATLRF